MTSLSKLALMILFLILPYRVSAQTLIADLSSHLVAITTGFTGAKVVMFGTKEGKGDIVITVEGPGFDTIIRKKNHIAGFWINRDQMTFIDIPGFYKVASTRPIEEIANVAVLKRHMIGMRHLRYTPKDLDISEFRDFKYSLIRLKQKEGLFQKSDQKIVFLGNKLFRATIDFPSNVPTGIYRVTTYLFEDGEVINAQVTPLSVSKLGLSAEISDFATKNASLYGIVAVLIAAVTGWFASILFRK